LAARGYRPTAIGVAWLEEGKPLTAASVWRRTIEHDTVKDALASRQAQAALALAQLGHPEAVWPLLKHTPDPSRRTYLIHALGRLKSDPGAILERLALGAKLDVSERRALILSLGEFTASQLPTNEREKLVPTLLRWYRDDPDPGIHSAIDWLLRHGTQGVAARKLNWDQAAALRKLDAELAGKEPGKHDWYVTAKEGHTFALIRKPEVFLMGSPLDEVDRFASEIPHRRHIDRSFAIATKEVTVAQFQRFLEATAEFKRRHSYLKKYSPEDDGPQVTVTWYEAAAYCNWLSKQEGIPEEQWVYPKDPADIKEGKVLAKGDLEKTGYRLPTEAEWEYACRAGASSRRFYGSAEALLGEYAWYPNHGGDQAWPVGQLKPNDLGLFDVYGNALEWTQSRYLPYPGGGRVYGDDEDMKYDVDDRDSWALRGGSFDYQAPYVRSANRNYRRPSSRLNSVGFRLARTYR
jgi:formylglycine-generating enzyme required for sulfatase activity